MSSHGFDRCLGLPSDDFPLGQISSNTRVATRKNPVLLRLII